MCTHAPPPPLSLSLSLTGSLGVAVHKSTTHFIIIFFFYFAFFFFENIANFLFVFLFYSTRSCEFFSGWSEIYCEINGCERAVMQRDRVGGGRARACGRGRGTQFTMQTSGK